MRPQQASTNAATPSRRKPTLGCSGISIGCLAVLGVLGLVAVVTGPRSTPASPAPTPRSPATATAPITAVAPAYRVIDEDIVEDAQKAQIDGRLVVDAAIAERDLDAVLRDYLARARARSGWRVHERTTHVFAYAYASEADLTGSGAGWVGMLAWRDTRPGAEPTISIDADRLDAARHAVERRGLPDARRREVHRALWEADQASARAGRDDEDANLRRIARRFSVSEGDVRAIAVEGIQRGW